MSKDPKRFEFDFNPEKIPDGRAFRFDGSENLQAGDGLTMIAVCRMNPAVGEVFFFKENHLVFSHEKDKLFANFFNGREWIAYTQSAGVIPPDGKWHQAAMVIQHHCVASQGEDWTDVRLYFDGVPVAYARHEHSHPAESPDPLVFGRGRSYGGEYGFCGAVASILVHGKAFTEQQIRESVLSDKRLKPGFHPPVELTPGEMELLKQVNAPPEVGSALRNLALGRRSGVIGWKELARDPDAALRDRKLRILDGGNSRLALADVNGFAGVVSWYDTVSRRELLSAENCFFRLNFKVDGQTFELDPLEPQVVSELISPPVESDGVQRFVIGYRHEPEETCPVRFTATSRFCFGCDRLEYDLSVDDSTPETRISQVVFPAMLFQPLTYSNDVMLVPQMSGVEMPEAVKRNACYTSFYPRGNAFAPMGAYYDHETGIYCAAEDPIARPKELEFSAGFAGCEFNFKWTPDYESPEKPNSFHPGCNAAAELFRGNWYDAGTIYRRQLGKINALWWEKAPDPVARPLWMRENTLWLRIDMHYQNLSVFAPVLKKLREYLGLPIALHLYDWNEPGSWLSPMVRATPQLMEDVAGLQAAGIRVVPYTTARIWQNPDRRGEDYLYSKAALPAAVIDPSGEAVIEHYGLPCAVLCPHTETYQNFEYEMTVRLAAQGFDGVYADQIGAAAPRLCYSTRHGHRIADNEAWFKTGQYPVYRRVRDHWIKHSPEKVLTTEDNAEHCVSLFHGLLNWRWMLENQVPLFARIYSGRTQLIGLDSVGEEPEAAFVKAATQTANGEQIGWFQHQKITSPLRHEFRVFIKRLMHLRRSMLDFFNDGEMARPVEFLPGQRRISRLWGRHGTYYVSSPPVLSSSWDWNGMRATVFINHTDKPENFRFRRTLPDDGVYALASFDSGGGFSGTSASGAIEEVLTMPGRSCRVLLAAPAGFDAAGPVEKFRRIFTVIAAVPEDRDPFLFDPAAMPSGGVRSASDWLYPEGEPDNTSVIRFGSIDYGGGARVIEAEFDAPVEHPTGQVTMHVDSLKPEDTVAVFDVGRDFPGGHSGLEPAVLRLRPACPLSGIHKTFFLLNDSSHCVFVRWRAVKNPEEQTV